MPLNSRACLSVYSFDVIDLRYRPYFSIFQFDHPIKPLHHFPVIIMSNINQRAFRWQQHVLDAFLIFLSRCAVLSSATISGRLSSKVLITQIRWSSPREHWSAFWCKSACIPNCWSIRLFFASESFPHREIFSLTVPSNTSGCAGRKDSWLWIAESSSSSSFLPDREYFYNNRQWPYQRSSRQDSHNSQTSVPNVTEGAKNAAQVFPANRNEPARWSQSLLCCTDGLSHISQPERGSEKKQSLQPGHFKIDCSIYNFRNKKGKAHFQSNRNSRQKHIKHCFSGYCFPDVRCIGIPAVILRFAHFFWSHDSPLFLSSI